MIFLLEAAQQLGAPEDINFGALILRMLIFLALILLVVFVVLKKVLPVFIPGTQFKTKNIRILERVPIDQRKALIIAEVQGKFYLMGCSDGQINILAELDPEKLREQESIAPRSGSFSDVLKRVLSKEKSS